MLKKAKTSDQKQVSDSLTQRVMLELKQMDIKKFGELRKSLRLDYSMVTQLYTTTKILKLYT